MSGTLDGLYDDTETPAPTERGGDARFMVPTLTIAHHPDLSRVGEHVRMARLLAGQQVELSRLAPLFAAPGREEVGRPLADRKVSRRPITLSATVDGGVRVARADDSPEVEVEGQRVVAHLDIGPGRLEAGVVLMLGRRVVFVLHMMGPPALGGPAPDDEMGLVGHSEGIQRLRQAIVDVADLDIPVLLRGETGTGKELAARAIHAASDRKARPHTSVNMAAIPTALAASELFGHVKGAFSGADRNYDGYFSRAHTGTLFLDEIGDAPLDVQVMLLRVLETGEIQPLGAAAPRHVDVRLIAATDADLDAAVDAGTFRAPLLHRLAGYEITIPALRERKDDIGRLLVHFLRHELQAMGAAHHLDASRGQTWLPAPLVYELVQHPWPGNVRQLRNVVRQLAISSRNADRVQLDGSVRRLLSQGAGPSSVAPAPPQGAAPTSRSGRSGVRPADLSEADLRAALLANGWRLGPTAELLGISRNSLYRLIDASPNFRKPRDIGRAEIEAGLEATGGDLGLLSERLEISKRGLKLRMKELGLR